jgi:hypothetical protein
LPHLVIESLRHCLFFNDSLNKRLNDSIALLNFFVRRVLSAPAAKLLLLDAVRGRLAVLHGRIVPLFALATLQCNDFSGHFKQLLTLLASGC